MKFKKIAAAAHDSHHASVPEDVTSYLPPFEEASLPWREHFDIDEMADTSFAFFFGGTLRRESE